MDTGREDRGVAVVITQEFAAAVATAGGGGGGGGFQGYRSVPARDLAVDHIGQIVRFDQRLEPGHIAAVVKGGLRQIYHTASVTTISVCNHEGTTGDLWEATLGHDQLVEVLT